MNRTAVCVSAVALCKAFEDKKARTRVEALKVIELTIPAGALTALVGPDGAGKTTFLRLMAGLMTADSGSLQVLGLDVSTTPQQVQDRISYMPQRFGLYEDLSVQENRICMQTCMAYRKPSGRSAIGGCCT